MSSEIAIKVKNLSKCYHIYEHPHDRLKQSLYTRLQRMFGKQPQQYFQEFWALKNVSLEIKKGEIVGIIGRNGSGKSTLLQMICGTLNSTSGSIQIHGRIAALLELGSGFNPEFTGRENVYMNAAVLGLSKEEISTRFDDIVTFSDIGDFIEHPVKTYSSGMMVRLAFAVIAHVDADILVIDEALSVGDAVFTQKCIRFLRRFMEQGTVLFVSHDIASVNNLCQKAIWLDLGTIRMRDEAEEVTKVYTEYCMQEIYGDSAKLTSVRSNKSEHSKEKQLVQTTKISFYEDIANSDGWKSGAGEILEVSISAPDGQPLKVFSGGENVLLQIKAMAHQDLDSPIIGFLVKDRLGQSLFGENTYRYVQQPFTASKGEILNAYFEFSLPLMLNGSYSMTVSLANGNLQVNTQHHWVHDAMIIQVQSSAIRYGLMGIQFTSVAMHKISD
jgi:lipopolysaccharide transport system ATP-binding protein